MFSKTVYIQMQCNRLILSHVESTNVITIDSSADFGNARMVISDFSTLESCIKKGLCALKANSSFLRLGATVLIHPLEIFADGLSEVEIIALKQAALGAGASSAFIYSGNVLALEQVKDKCCD